MSIDKARSRKEIDHELESREREQDERLEKSEKVVEDKKIEVDTAKELKLVGTSEGTEEVKKEIQSAAEETDQEFEAQEKELQEKVFQKAREFEREMQDRLTAAEHDGLKIEQGFSRIETKNSAHKLNEAKRASEKDRDYFDDTVQEQERDRSEGEEELKEQKEEIKETEVEFADDSSPSDSKE